MSLVRKDTKAAVTIGDANQTTPDVPLAELPARVKERFPELADWERSNQEHWHQFMDANERRRTETDAKLQELERRIAALEA